VFFFFKQKTAYEIFTLLEFRRVLFRSLNFTPQQLAAEADALHYAAYAGERLVATAYLLPLVPARAHLRQMAVSPGMRASGVGGRSEERRVGKESQSLRGQCAVKGKVCE